MTDIYTKIGSAASTKYGTGPLNGAFKDGADWLLGNLHELSTEELLKDERVKTLVEAAKLGLFFAPKVEPPQGLDPTFYHTLNYEDECALMARLTDAREALAEWEREC